MKQIFLSVVLLFFVANNIVVSAWVKSCATDGQQNYVLSASANLASDTPCHDQSNHDDSMHCEHLCLCLNATVTQTPMIDLQGFSLTVDHSNRMQMTDSLFYSITTIPLYRPPILSS